VEREALLTLTHKLNPQHTVPHARRFVRLLMLKRQSAKPRGLANMRIIAIGEKLRRLAAKWQAVGLLALGVLLTLAWISLLIRFVFYLFVRRPAHRRQ
jgi:hypothetical protein